MVSDEAADPAPVPQPLASIEERSSLWTVGYIVVGVALLAYVIPAFASAYWLRTLTSVCILAVASVSVGLLYAQLGMVSLCQYALVGVGGWFALRISYASGLPFEVSLVGGGIAAALFGLLFGLPALRMRGLFLALITLMIAGGFQVIVGATDFPDGGPGLLGKTVLGQRAAMVRPFLAQSDGAYFRYTIAVLVVAFLIILWHKRSRAGRAWAMIRRSEACALSAGVNIVAYKVWAFALAGFLAGIAGGLLAGSVGQLDQASFPASESIMIFALTVIGGAYSWLGAIVAGLLLRAVPALLNDWGVNGNIATIVFGAGLLNALITAPQGVAGQLADLGALLKKKLRPQRSAP